MNFHKRWELKAYDSNTAKMIEEELAVSKIVAQLLVQRGVKTVEDSRKFLYAGLEDLSNPFDMKGIKTAVARIKQAITKKEKIVVYGDYDVDGVCSTVLLTECLQVLGAKTAYYVPNRFSEGYGLNSQAIENIFAEGCSLLISVDCGINSVEEVAIAAGLGMDVIITDHHTPAENLPAAVAIINPKLDQNEDIINLAGVGVAFKLAAALGKNHIAEEQLYEWLDIVALATVTDIVPLLGENRILLRYGLDRLTNTKRPGLRALFKEAGLTGKSILPWHLGFVLGPRLNSAGRMNSARSSIELLLTDDQIVAGELAASLENMNNERRLIEEGIFQEAVLYIENNVDLDREAALILGDDNWHHGVVGIVASRLANKYQRPVILICWEGDTGRGSARSISGIDIYAAINHCGSCLLQFGGHKMAAGLSISRDQFPAFKNELLNWINLNIDNEDFCPVHFIDAELEIDEINQDLLKEIEILAPFGEGNPIPYFALRSLGISQPSLVGKQQEHFKLLTEPGAFEGIAFNMPQFMNMPFDTCYHDLLFELGENDFRGRKSIQFKIKDMKGSFHPDRHTKIGFTNELVASLGRAVAQLQNNQPVMFVFPTNRILMLLQSRLARFFRPARLKSLHGFLNEKDKLTAGQELKQGVSRIFLLTHAYLQYYLKANDLPPNLHYIVEVGLDSDNLSAYAGSRSLDRLYNMNKPITWERVAWNYDDLKTTIIYANRRRTIQKLTQQVPDLIAATGIKDVRTRQALCRRFREIEPAVLLTDSNWREIAGESPSINELYFADVPFSIWETAYVMEQLAASSEYKAKALFDSKDIKPYKEYLIRIYPNLERIKTMLNFFKHLGRKQLKTKLDDLLARLGEWSGCEFESIDLWPILRIMEDLGLCSYEKKGSIIALMFHSREKKLVDISESSYYMEGLAEKKAFSRLEMEINKYLVR